jgi:hypothetical protein
MPCEAYSFEPDYDRARKRFRSDSCRRFGHYLISDKYREWSKSTTWRYIGIRNDVSERKKLGPMVSLFREWRFIEETEGADKYRRVEESIPYLKRLFEKLEST